ncbi:nucleolar complex protein 14, partial [Ceratobasidium sp. 392]
RKKTLLVEYDERDRAGGIVDRRFGENDASVAPEERMLERFTKERQRRSKGEAFNLEDDEELTHYGQSLSALDDFDGAGIELDDDEEGGQIDASVVRQSHFGGFEPEEKDDADEPERKKSKAEVMSEVIAKSKAYKAERQEQREADDNVRHELDQEFASIRELLYAPAPPDPSSSGSNSIPLGRPRPQQNLLEDQQATTDDASKEQSGPTAKTDEDYDQFVRELVFDKRSRPTDRLKTEEEVAREAAEALEKAEKARLRRMRGEESESDDERAGKRRKRVAEADDLDDDFVGDEGYEYGLGAGLEGKDQDEDEDEDNSDDDESNDEGSDEEESDEESDGGDDEGGSEVGLSDMSDGAGDENEPVEGEIEDLVTPKSRHTKSKGKSKTIPTSTLPFTFPFPSTHPELLEILQDIQEEDVPTVIQRIRVQYHPSLAEGNKQKLQYESFSKRLVPEVINFLANACLHIAPHKFTLKNLPGWFPAPDLNSSLSQSIRLKSSSKVTPSTPSLSNLMSLEGNGSSQDRVDVLALAFTLLARFAQMYASLDGFMELFSPIQKVLEGLVLNKQSAELQKRHASTLDAISHSLKHSLASRKPLRLQAHKPLPIATYVPQFDAQYSGRRPRDPDQERAADVKLRAEYKKERKGALRELRKDNRFLAAERAKRQAEADAAYRQKMARVVGDMHSERAEEKQMEMEKKREKKRAGKK